MLKNREKDLLPTDLDIINTRNRNKSITHVNRIQQRAQIAVLNQIGINKHQISGFLKRDISTITRWTTRFQKAIELNDKNRPGRPANFKEDIRLKTISFYCQTSPLPGLSHFSLRDAAKYLKEHNEILGCELSHSTISRFLKSHSLKPHLNKYFLSITDADFFPKMQHIIDVYLNPPEYLFCFDECPGIQALMPTCPDLPVDKNVPNYIDFLYKRNGTVNLLAFLQVKTGNIFGRCSDNHNRHTLISVFKQHISLQPSHVQLHYIMDNLNTHFHNDFCKVVAQLSNIKYTPLKNGVQRREWLQNDNKRIVIHFTPFHGSWLNMIEIWFGILNQKSIKPRRFDNVDTLKEIIMNFIDTWNQYFAHPFTWKYKGDGLHEKAVSRFNKVLLIKSKQMDISFLNKQLLLMSNICQQYPSIIKTKQWNQLKELITLKKEYLTGVINSSNKKRIKPEVRQNLDNVIKILNCQF